MAKPKAYPGVIAFVVKYGDRYANGGQMWRKSQRRAFYFRCLGKPDRKWAFEHMLVMAEKLLDKKKPLHMGLGGKRSPDIYLRVVAIVPRRKVA